MSVDIVKTITEACFLCFSTDRKLNPIKCKQLNVIKSLLENPNFELNTLSSGPDPPSLCYECERRLANVIEFKELVCKSITRFRMWIVSQFQPLPECKSRLKIQETSSNNVYLHYDDAHLQGDDCGGIKQEMCIVKCEVEELPIEYEEPVIDLPESSTFVETVTILNRPVKFSHQPISEQRDHGPDDICHEVMMENLPKRVKKSPTLQSSQGSQNIIIETGHHQDQLNTRHTINVIVNSNKKERQKRYREQNRDKLKQREAERRKRIQYLQSIARPSTSSNTNRIELNNKEIITAQSSFGLAKTQPLSIQRNEQGNELNALQKKRERQQRYREQNKDKLKQREAERRRRLQNAQTITELSVSPNRYLNWQTSQL